MRIALLHSLENNPAVFTRAAAALGLAPSGLRHAVRADLRTAIEQQGGPTARIKADIHACLQELAAQADVVVVTCAALGASIDDASTLRVPIVRADKALARAAAETGGKLVVVCAAESAVDGTRRLFEAHAHGTGTTVTVRHVPEIWDLYLQGNLPAALERTAAAASDAYAAGAVAVAFAHPWMADAVRPAADGRMPLDSAHAALRAATASSGL